MLRNNRITDDLWNHLNERYQRKDCLLMPPRVFFKHDLSSTKGVAEPVMSQPALLTPVSASGVPDKILERERGRERERERETTFMKTCLITSDI